MGPGFLDTSLVAVGDKLALVDARIALPENASAVKVFKQLAASDTAATLVEYSLLTSLIAIVVLLVVGNFGTQLATMFGAIGKAMSVA